MKNFYCDQTIIGDLCLFGYIGFANGSSYFKTHVRNKIYESEIRTSFKRRAYHIWLSWRLQLLNGYLPNYVSKCNTENLTSKYF